MRCWDVLEADPAVESAEVADAAVVVGSPEHAAVTCRGPAYEPELPAVGRPGQAIIFGTATSEDPGPVPREVFPETVVASGGRRELETVLTWPTPDSYRVVSREKTAAGWKELWHMDLKRVTGPAAQQ